MSDICAVVVTFNRKDMLVDCLKELGRQSKKLDKIFIIDNDSNDGTYALLEEQGYISNPLYEYTNTKANLGGAGGFKFGMKKAYDLGYEWIWIMDDDVKPTLDGLENLYKYKSISNFIHPTKYFSDGSKFHWEGFYDPMTSLMHWRKGKSGFEDSDYVSVNYGCFEGALINREIISKIGLPDERFFIQNDDLLYGFLASQHTNVIYIKETCLIKMLKKESFKKFLFIRNESFSPFATYFIIRNQYLMKEYLSKLSYANNKILNVVTMMKCVKMFLEVILFERSLSHFKMFWRGMNDGRHARYDGHKDFIS
ncbi:MAG: glycosyltransferase [Bdellovibrionota bacterium]|nr:glycosyltransferase [Bdellovibrionota bacterium]